MGYNLLLAIIIYFAILYPPFFSATSVIAENERHLVPKIIDIKSSPTPIINQWVILRQKSSGELHLDVVAENVVKVRFWTVPVKNKSWQDSWEHKQLISEDANGNDGWTTTFYYGNENLLTFIVVEAIGSDGKSARWPFYVAYKK